MSFHLNIISLTLSFSPAISMDLFLLYIDLIGSIIRSHNEAHLQQEKEDIKYGFRAFDRSVLALIYHTFVVSFQGNAYLLLTILVTKTKQVTIFILKYLTSWTANSVRSVFVPIPHKPIVFQPSRPFSNYAHIFRNL